MLYLAENASVIEKLAYGFKVMLLGMGTVFAVLLILWLVLMIFQAVFTKKEPKVTENQSLKALPAVASAPVDTSASVTEYAEDDSELVAVIMAAVYAASGAEPGTLRIVSYKRQKTPWNRK